MRRRRAWHRIHAVENLARERDNIKVLICWFIPLGPARSRSSPLVLTRLWRGRLAARIVAATCLVGLTLSGALDVWRVMTRAKEWRDFDDQEIAVGR